MGLFLAFGFLCLGFEGGDVGTLYGGEGADLILAILGYGFLSCLLGGDGTGIGEDLVASG